MSQLPATITGDITRDINALIAASDRMRDPNSREIRDVYYAAEKLQKANARAAFVAFGHLAALCGDADGVLDYFRKAMYLPEKGETKRDFMVVMGNAGLYSQAHELAQWLIDPRNGYFISTWQRALSIGMFRSVWDRLVEAKRLYEELRELDFSLVETAAAVMAERQLTDANIGAVLNLMGEIQRSHKIMFCGTEALLARVMRPPEDPAYLYLTMPLDAAVPAIHVMNRELARAVAEKLPDGAFPSGLVCSFVKHSSIKLRAAA